MRTLNTLEEVREVFAAQLETTAKCTGDYLNGRTKEELVSLIIKNAYGISPEDALKMVERNIQEHSAHAGQAKLFLLRETLSSASTPTEKHLAVQVLSIWEDELPEFIGANFDYMVGESHTAMPKFIMHNIIYDAQSDITFT